MTPALSVVMAVYNGEPYLTAAMESVLGQTFRDFEFIVIDDCSTDRTAAIVQGYGDPRVVYLRNEKNIGQTRSLNVGIGVARAPLIARIDSDDLFYPTKLEKQVAYLSRHPEIAVLGTGAHIIDEIGRQVGLVTSPVDDQEIRFRMVRGVPVIHVTVVMRVDALQAVGGYDADVRYSQDYALWSQFTRGGYRIANLAETLGAFRERSDSVNATNKLGGATDETCRITQRNARDFVGLELSLADCRAIDLLMFPSAGLSTDEMIGAVQNLRRIADRVWPSVPWKLRVSLLARLVWALSKRLELARVAGNAKATRRELLAASRVHLSDPAIASAIATAYAVSAAGFGTIARVKAVATRFLVR